jgi:class 3 adenylate cyclase
LKYKLSIHTYLIVFLLSFLIPFTSFSLYQAYQLADEKRLDYDKQCKQRRDFIALFITQLFNQHIKGVEIIAKTIETTPNITGLEKQSLLDQLHQSANMYQGMYIADDKATSVYFSPLYNQKGERNAGRNYQERDYFKKLLQTKKTTISKLQRGKVSLEPTFQIATPLFDFYQNFVGYIIGNVFIDKLEQKAMEMVQENPNFRIVLADHIGQLVFDTHNISKVLSDFSQQEMFKHLQENTKLAYLSIDEKGVPISVYAHHLKIGDQEWHLFVCVSQDIIEKEAIALRNKVILYALLMLLFILLVSYLITSKLSLMIKIMLSFVQKIGDGKIREQVKALPGIAILEIDQMQLAIQEAAHKLDENEKLKQRQVVVENSFGKYLPKAVLQELMKNDRFEIKNQSAHITILFSDIRQFTDFSENLSAELLANLLNHYFEPMTDAVLQEQGVVDKYIGDAIMAFFGMPIAHENHPQQALNAVIRMHQSLQQLKIDFQQYHWPLDIGIGINTGNAIVGNLGSSQRLNYTVIGDCVNLASRIESLTSTYKIFCLVGEETRNNVNHEEYLFREIDFVKVKGKATPIRLYEFLGTDQYRIIHYEQMEVFDEAVMLYRNKDFKASEILFERFLSKNIRDHVSRIYLQRIDGIKGTTVPDNWDGIIRYHSKS